MAGLLSCRIQRDELTDDRQGARYQLFHPNRPRADISSPSTSVLQAYDKHILETDSADLARSKIENEIRRLPTATWQWENQSENNPLGDLRVFRHLPVTRLHKWTGRWAFFNNAVSRYLNAKNAGTLNPPYLNKERK